MKQTDDGGRTKRLAIGVVSHVSSKGPNRNDESEPFCSHCGYSPTGEAQGWREEADLDSGSDLFEAILEASNVESAWKRVKANRGAAGFDGVTIAEFPELFRLWWPEIRAELLEGSYDPSPVLRVEIDKPNGGKRQLGIPIVLDRVIQQSIAQVIGPILDPSFSEYSFGFRPKRSAHQAVKHVSENIKAGRRIAVDLDLSKFFDWVDHDILMNRLARRIRDKRVLRLVGKYLRAGVMVGRRLQRTTKGVPQGGPLSPLLANAMLDDLDKELERRGHCFARYADDFVVLVKSRRAGERVMSSVRCLLERRLKLRVNEEKSKVVKTSELQFLGFVFNGWRIKWNRKAFEVFVRRIRKLTGRNWGVSMRQRIKTLAQYVRGWLGYYGIGRGYAECRKLDHWMRRRIRCCYWKQWKTRRKRIGNLLKLGAHPKWAILCGLSRRGPWRMSRNPAINKALSNAYLFEQGTPSLAKIWANIHYPTTVR